MNYDQPPRTNWVKILAFILGALALLFVAFVFTGYYVLMHTSIPFKMIEAALAEGGTNQNFKVEGIQAPSPKGSESNPSPGVRKTMEPARSKTYASYTAISGTSSADKR